MAATGANKTPVDRGHLRAPFAPDDGKIANSVGACANRQLFTPPRVV
jgi:hypothetical protein